MTVRSYPSGQRYYEDTDGVITIDAMIHDRIDDEVCIEIADGAAGDRGENLTIHLDRATLNEFIIELAFLRDQLPHPTQPDNTDKENQMPFQYELCMRCNLAPATRHVLNEFPSGATTTNMLCDPCTLAVVMLTINDAQINIGPLYTDEQPATKPDTWDGQEWRKARDGDIIKLRDPDTRDDGPQYVIDGVPTFDGDQMTVYCARLCPDGMWMAIGTRVFNEACWQVWHDFGRVG